MKWYRAKISNFDHGGRVEIQKIGGKNPLTHVLFPVLGGIDPEFLFELLAEILSVVESNGVGHTGHIICTDEQLRRPVQADLFDHFRYTESGEAFYLLQQGALTLSHHLR